MYKKECIDELKRYIDIAADECCKECEICCESNNCILTKIKDGMANVFGIEIGKEKVGSKGKNKSERKRVILWALE